MSNYDSERKKILSLRKLGLTPDDISRMLLIHPYHVLDVLDINPSTTGENDEQPKERKEIQNG